MMATGIGDGQVLIGTSGWVYGHWRDGVYYPKDMRSSEYLRHYSWDFRTTELNGSHYKTPTPKAVRSWYEQTPGNFVFTWKISKYVTHWRRLRNCYESMQKTLESACQLREKLGPLLVQMGPNHAFSDERLDDLGAFLYMLPAQLQIAVEFRHESWYRKELLWVLDEYNSALVEHDHANGPTKGFRGASTWRYVRLHGPTGQCWGNYGDNVLTDLGARLAESGNESFVYFNNDIGGAAPVDAKRLVGLVRSTR